MLPWWEVGRGVLGGSWAGGVLCVYWLQVAQKALRFLPEASGSR